MDCSVVRILETDSKPATPDTSVTVTVKNTFITVIFDDEQDDEFEALQAQRRRHVQSCPYFSSPAEPESEASPSLRPASPEPAAEPFPTFDAGVCAFTPSDKALSVPQEFCAELATWASTEMSSLTRTMQEEASAVVHRGDRRATTHELQLLQMLLRDDMPSIASPDNVHLSSHASPGCDMAAETRATHDGGLPLFRIPRTCNSITDCFDFMLDAPTPVILKLDCQDQAPTFGMDPCSEMSMGHHTRTPTFQECAKHDESENALVTAAIDQSQSSSTRRHCPQRRGSRSGGQRRLWCHVHLNPAMLEPGFDVVKKIIGKGGRNTTNIWQATQTKVRVRGRGSGHKEHNGREANVPLMIALAAEHGCSEDFRVAFQMTKDLVTDVSKRFEQFLEHHEHLRINLRMTDRPFWVGDISKVSEEHLGGLLEGLRAEGSESQH